MYTNAISRGMLGDYIATELCDLIEYVLLDAHGYSIPQT